MNKKEFLAELRSALQGNISPAQVNENVNYYDNYIIEEMQKGKSEEQVITMLGNPRLLAKTIIDTSGQSGRMYEEADYQETDQTNNGEHARGFHADYSEEDGWDVRIGRFKLNSWYGTLTIIVAVVLIVFIVGSVFVALLPVIFAVLMILMILGFIFGSRK